MVEVIERRRRARLPLAFPLALLPFAVASLLASGALTSTGVIAFLRILRAHARNVQELSKRISGDLSRLVGDQPFRRISGDVSRRISGDVRRWLRSYRSRPSNLALHVAALGGAFSLLGYFLAVLRSLSLMNVPEEELDPEFKEKLDANLAKPKWGRGLPAVSTRLALGSWRPYLAGSKGLQESLEELHGSLGLYSRAPSEMTLDQMAEGIRRLFIMKYPELPLLTDQYWSEAQALKLAANFAAECGLQQPLPRGGLEECSPDDLTASLPWRTPLYVQVPQRWGIAALRPILTNVLRWTSRYLETPYGRLHIYDTSLLPQQARESSSQPRPPPLLMQHGMFVTGWSMAALAWLLSLRGRRVLIPDLFDFDNGLSRSEGGRTGGKKVRRPMDSVEALTWVVRSLVDEGASTVDISGHSFGAFLMALLARRCEREGLPVRKVVLLGPGGPFFFLNNTSTKVRMLNNPLETIDAGAPWRLPVVSSDERLAVWVPAWLLKLGVRCVFGVLLSPNNVNLLLALRYAEYFGATSLGASAPTLLLWGTEDFVAPPRRLRYLGPYLRRNFDNIEAFWVRGGGHNIQIDSVVAVARAMHEWLDGHAIGTSLGGRSSFVERLLTLTDRPLEAMNFPAEATVSEVDTGRSRL